MNQRPAKLKSAVIDFAFPGLRQTRADARTQLQLEKIEATFNDIWERFKRIERVARSTTRHADEISRQLTQSDFAYEQFYEAQKYRGALWELFQSSRKLRSRLNRLIFKSRMLALQCQAEDSSKALAASSLLTDVRAIESGVSEVTKTLEVAHAKFVGLMNQKAVQSQVMLADSQRRAGFLAASQETLLLVLLGPDSTTEERVLAARKIASLANLAAEANLAMLVSGFLIDDPKSFRGKASDLTATLTAHTCLPADALKSKLVDLVSLASMDKTVDAKLAVSGLMAPALGDWLPELGRKLQLSWISKALQLNGLEGIRISNTNGSALLDQIEAELDEDAYISSAEMVSVLVPVRNGEKWLATAIRSLQGQTWRNIEVIIVDDASEDSTLELALQIAASDSRVKVIASKEQKGAYTARNVALDFAVGDFVTVHDADDWSHPRKIERQVRHLVQNPAIQANLTQSARVVGETLAFHAYLGKEILRQNSSSLMCRRQVFRDLGYWDEVPFGADTEFHHRLVAAYGSEASQVLNTGVLSLTRFHADSLSGGGAGSMALGINSSRATYMNSFNNWHLDNAGDLSSLRLERGASNRPFDLPAEFLNIEHEGETYPLALVGDLSRDSQNTKDILDWLRANPGFSRRIALRHTPEPKHPSSSLSTEFAEFSTQIVVLERSTRPNALKNIATAGSILNATPLDSFSKDGDWEVLVRDNGLSSGDLYKISSVLQVGEHEVRQVVSIIDLLDEVAKESSKKRAKNRSRVSS